MSALAQTLSVKTTANESGGQIAQIIFERPEAMNSFSQAMLAEMEQRIKKLAADRNTRVLIVTGQGKAFSAGADLKERATMTEPEVRDFLRRIGQLFLFIERLPFPTIAAINGFALGGGLELALCFDIRIASAGAQMGLTETSLGIIPGAGGTQRLSRVIGAARAKEMILTARRVEADEALRMGLITEQVEGTALGERSLALASQIARNAPIALRQAKRAIDGGRHLDIEAALALEQEAYAVTLTTKDRVEALSAFREKRKPRFTGE